MRTYLSLSSSLHSALPFSFSGTAPFLVDSLALDYCSVTKRPSSGLTARQHIHQESQKTRKYRKNSKQEAQEWFRSQKESCCELPAFGLGGYGSSQSIVWLMLWSAIYQLRDRQRHSEKTTGLCQLINRPWISVI